MNRGLTADPDMRRLRRFPARAPRAPRAFLAGVVMGALGLFASPSLPAFVLEGGGANWVGSSSIPIRLQLGAPATGSLLDGSGSFDKSVQQAIRLWNHYLQPSPQIAATIGATGPGAQNDGANSMFFANNYFGTAFGPNVLAVTVYHTNGFNFLEADIVFNAARPWNSYKGNLQSATDIQRVAIHELGHALGLDHPDQAGQQVNAIMNSQISDLELMQDDDIRGINSLYHGNSAPGTTGVLTNLSTRLNVGSGAAQGIPGFIITGTGSKTVIIRAMGPSLTAFGVSGALQTPALQVMNANQNQITQNTGWKNNNATDRATIQNANLAPAFDAECAVVVTLPPGAYTALVSGLGGTGGVALVEVYDISPAVTSAKLSNVSTRGNVQTGANVMIGGFIIGGTLPKSIAIRAIGPTLTPLGVPGALADPTLTLFDSAGNQIYFNNNWRDSESSSLSGTSIAPTSSLESTILLQLVPGAYTAIVRGANNSSGIGRVDILDLQ